MQNASTVGDSPSRGAIASQLLDVFHTRYVPVTESGCWLWIGTCSSHGYGLLQKQYAHRISYIHFKGPIPNGLQIDHICRVRSCVNPDHLEAVTAQENKRRGEGIAVQNARKSHCISGHVFNENNTYIRTHPSGRQTRQCRICKRRAFLAFHQRQSMKGLDPMTKKKTSDYAGGAKARGLPTPMRAIRLKCLSCTCDQVAEIRECTIKLCPLWPYRMGRRPKP